jgi:putative glycoprotease GCP
MSELILAIESSCDDSSISLLDINTLELKFHKKISQDNEHSAFGGVVPELAARLHTAALPKILEQISSYFSEVRAVAVTNEPGLSVSLISGVSMAKALCIGLGVPLISVNHLVGHIYSLFLSCDAKLPLGVLLVSGGHTMILDIDKNGTVKILAQTSDDSFGESFDKVAKMLGLGYPGGVAVQEMAKNGIDYFKFTIPLLHNNRLEYSFSGLKNQVRMQIDTLGHLSSQDKANICFAFENTACKHILNKLEIIFKERNFKHFGVVGGASANIKLRAGLNTMCKKFNCELLVAPLDFCSDNAAMIARAGREKYLRGDFINQDKLNINPRSSFDRI